MNRHIVDFEKWCKTCKYRDNEEYEEPCDDCLPESDNEDSRKPVMWKEDK